MSEETKKKIREASRRKVHSEETKEKLRQAAIKNNFGRFANINREKINAVLKVRLSKPVLQIDKEGNIVNEFSSISEAAEFAQTQLASDKTFLGMMNGIHRHCTGNTKKRFYYGFEWKFRADV